MRAGITTVALAAASVLLISICALPMVECAHAQPPPSGVSEYGAHCANCHGAKLEGGVHAPPLIGPQFQGNWAGKRARLLYSRIISTMPQNDPGTLSPQQVLAITLYVFASNGIEWVGHTPSSPNDLNTLTIPAGSPSSSPPAASSK
jgi:S-disulfanyl-L-cysteine oxidoreductase SoxD